MTARLTKPLFGIDRGAYIPLAAHHAIRSQFALRYLSRYTAKVPSAQEVHELQAAGIGLAALLAGKLDVKGKVVVGILSGGNVDAEMFAKLVSE